MGCITDYKTCEYYSEKQDDLFDNNPNVTVVGCKVHGIRALCIHNEIWKDCLMSQHEAFYRYKYRLKNKIAIHAQLRELYDRKELSLLKMQLVNYVANSINHDRKRGI